MSVVVSERTEPLVVDPELNRMEAGVENQQRDTMNSDIIRPSGPGGALWGTARAK